MTRLDQFVREQCFPIPGQSIEFRAFAATFIQWLPPELQLEWPTARIARAIPPQYPRGRRRGSVHRHLGNISFSPDAPASATLFRGPDGVLTVENPHI